MTVVDDNYTGHVEPGTAARRVLPGASIVKASVGPMDNNAYLVTCSRTGESLLIDAANDATTLLDLIAQHAPTLTLIVTSHGRPGHLKRALSAGVRGFLPKTVSAQVLADVVRTVHAGGRYVDPQLAAEAISTGDSPLTSRETDVLELAAAGTPIEDIARRAALSPGTVRNYLSSAATKLGAANRHDAALRARSHGWI